MKTRCLLLLVWGLLAGCAPGRVPQKPLVLFLLVGQSNMAGRGATEAQDLATHPRIWVLGPTDQWVPAKEPLHFDKPALVGVGPGLAFAKKLAEAYPKIRIGLVPCAVGGSPISAWQPGAFYAPTQTHPYDQAVRRAKLALAKGRLGGILWHQGEADSQPGLAPHYPEKLAQLVAQLRRDLGQPSVPFVAGTLGDFLAQRNPHARQINDQLGQLPQRVPHCHVVTAAGLAHKGDTLHFDSPAYRELGRRYAQVFIDKQLL